jgi:hypothetical protein
MELSHSSRLSSVASCSRRCTLDDGVPNRPRISPRNFSRQMCRIKGLKIKCLESLPVHNSREIVQHSQRRLHCTIGAAHGDGRMFGGPVKRAQRSWHAERDVSVHMRPIPALESDTAHPSPDQFAEIKAGEPHLLLVRFRRQPIAIPAVTVHDSCILSAVLQRWLGQAKPPQWLWRSIAACVMAGQVATRILKGRYYLHCSPLPGHQSVSC